MPQVVGNRKVNKEAELSAIRRAFVVERRALYPDLEGKRSTFSQFMRQTSDRLCRRFPADTVWFTIRSLFRQYPNSDVGTRISIIKRAEELLEPFWAQQVTKQSLDSEPDIQSDSGNFPTSKRSEVQTTTHGGGPKMGDNLSERSSETTKKREIKSEVQQKSRPSVKTVSIPTSNSPEPVTAARPQSSNPRSIPVQYVRGVGPKVSAVLSRLNINTVEDLLRHYPRRHLDFQNRLLIKDLQIGQEVTIFGTIRTVSAYQSKRGNVSIVTVVIHDGTGSVTITRFIGGKSNRYLLERVKSQFPKGVQVLASGVVERDQFSNRLSLKNGEVELLGQLSGEEELEDGNILGGKASSLHTGRLVPVYPLTEGLSLRYLRNIIHNALETYGDQLSDPLPDSIKQNLDLISLRSAMQQIHFPEDPESKDAARRRLVFDELFTVQLQLAQRRHKFDVSEGALSLEYRSDGLVKQLVDSLPFKLTGAQERVFREIAKDLASHKPMHRLVQGDVGSGKTIVALMAFLIAIEHNFQGVMMAPTEILAEQHFRQFQRLLAPLGLRCALVIGKQGQKERRQVRQDLSSGQVHIAVGTHALLEEDVEFKNLGLIIIDEQHRFGVKQRARLKAKSQSPELLTMTATPIPRTLALTMHGDLDVSEIDEMPPGRKPIETKLLRPSQKKQLYEFIRKEIDQGRQAYIVFPLIEESETLSAKAATKEYEKLKTESIFEGLNIGLMHGKLKPQEKDEVMDKFRDKQHHILVCTTVIEVGVDVSNASVMVIENADRFGLSQLHQLRGRVGRGSDQSYCFLITDSRAPQTTERLGILEQTNDGFVVAEKDLEIRGPGEFLGYRQSGLPDLLLADLVQDARILEEARKAAIDLVKDDPELHAYPKLAEYLKSKAVANEPEVLRSG